MHELDEQFALAVALDDEREDRMKAKAAHRKGITEEIRTVQELQRHVTELLLGLCNEATGL